MNEEKTAKDEPLFRTHKTVSIEEIMAAGGPTEYGRKLGKNNQSFIEAMKKAPPAEPMTVEEFEDLLQQLRDTK